MTIVVGSPPAVPRRTHQKSSLASWLCSRTQPLEAQGVAADQVVPDERAAARDQVGGAGQVHDGAGQVHDKVSTNASMRVV